MWFLLCFLFCLSVMNNVDCLERVVMMREVSIQFNKQCVFDSFLHGDKDHMIKLNNQLKELTEEGNQWRKEGNWKDKDGGQFSSVESKEASRTCRKLFFPFFRNSIPPVSRDGSFKHGFKHVKYHISCELILSRVTFATISDPSMKESSYLREHQPFQHMVEWPTGYWWGSEHLKLLCFYCCFSSWCTIDMKSIDCFWMVFWSLFLIISHDHRIVTIQSKSIFLHKSFFASIFIVCLCWSSKSLYSFKCSLSKCCFSRLSTQSWTGSYHLYIGGFSLERVSDPPLSFHDNSIHTHDKQKKYFGEED